MTTIAFKDGILAADRLVTGRYSRLGMQTKIKKYGDKLVGATGTLALCEKFMAWAEHESGDCPPTSCTDVKGEEIADYSGFIIRRSGITVFHAVGPWSIDLKMNAWGSGMDHALGAMAFGASAEEAVKVAAIYDLATGTDVDVISFD